MLIRKLILIVTCALSFSAFAGGRDGGGGNTINGKPIESYIVDPMTIPGMSKLVTQLETLKGAYYTNDWLMYLFKKPWYLVPGPLTNLPADRIGAAVGSDQVALQDFSAVWIDQTQLGKMAEMDQAEILLHEIFMGFRLLKLDSDYDRCIASNEKYHFDSCETESQVMPHQPSDLTAADYDSIRQVVRKLMDHPQLDQTGLYALLYDSGFSMPGTRMSPIPPPAHVEDLVHAIRHANLSNIWPSYGYDQDAVIQPHGGYSEAAYNQKFKPTDHCQISAAFGKDGKSLALTIRSIHKKPFVIHVNSIQPDDAVAGAFFFYLDPQGNSARAMPNDESSIGKKVTWLIIKLDRIGSDFHGRYITQAVINNITVFEAFRDDTLGNDQPYPGRMLLCSGQSVMPVAQ